jgi:hypothetical protein
MTAGAALVAGQADAAVSGDGSLTAGAGSLAGTQSSPVVIGPRRVTVYGVDDLVGVVVGQRLRVTIL